MTELIFGVFGSFIKANAFVEALNKYGHSREGISVLSCKRTKIVRLQLRTKSNGIRHVLLGVESGGILGSLMNNCTLVGFIRHKEVMAVGPVTTVFIETAKNMHVKKSFEQLVGLGVFTDATDMIARSLAKGCIMIGIDVSDKEMDFVRELMKVHDVGKIFCPNFRLCQ